MQRCPHCMLPSEDEICRHCGGARDWTAPEYHLPVGSTLSVGGGWHTYQLGAALGQGGFGITYIGCLLETEQRVAIKEYFPIHCAQRSADHGVCARSGREEAFQKGKDAFLQEAKLLAGLGALTTVVRVEDFFQANGTAYMVMEYLDGTPLNRMVEKSGPIAAAELLPKLHPLLQDIQRMHEAELIHRDISPDNIMWMPDGSLKLLDFGSARSTAEDRSMTVMLKQGFAPLEQYQSRGQGPWTDVYAMAATIYYCLTGVIPPNAVERRGEDTLQAPSALGAAVSQQVEAALMWALTVLPDFRPRTMGAFAEQLFLEPEPDPEPAPEPLPEPEPTPGPIDYQLEKNKGSSASRLATLWQTEKPLCIAIIAGVLVLVILLCAVLGTAYSNSKRKTRQTVSTQQSESAETMEANDATGQAQVEEDLRLEGTTEGSLVYYYSDGWLYVYVLAAVTA